MKHIITITKEDFLNHDYSDNRKCPLAIALKRHFPKAEFVSVGYTSFTVKMSDDAINRHFGACRSSQISNNTNGIQMAEYIFRNANSKDPKPFTFNFITP